MGWEDERKRITDTGLTVGELFEQTYPGQGQQMWEEENRRNNPPPAPTSAGASGTWTNPNTGVTYGYTPGRSGAPGLNPSTPTSSGMGGQWPSNPPGGPPVAAPPPGSWLVNTEDKGWTPVPGKTAPPTQPVPKGMVPGYDPTKGWVAGPAAGQGASKYVNPLTGEVEDLTPEQYGQVKADWAAVGEMKKRLVDLEEYATRAGLDLQRAQAEWKRTYDEAMLRYQNDALAQQAAYQAMEVSLRQQQLAMQQRSMDQDRRRRRPFRSARVRVVA